VVTAHGSDIPGYNPDRFKTEHRVTTPLLRLIMRQAAGLTAPSAYLKDLMIEACGPFEIAHIPNGIDPSLFGIRPKQKRILMTGRLLPRKGFQWVLEALQAIQTDWEIHIAGDGPMRDELETLAGKLDTEVVFHGWIEHDDPLLRELYETSSIFCLPSERENASISLLEAMLAGMAVVTSNVSGCPETVGDAGFVVPPRDPNALRPVLQRLLDSPELCREYGAKGRARVEERFNWDAVTTRYLQMLEAVCEGGSA
jgi:glycosyltransferase involved in cell wall biosynthesis